MKSKLFRKYFLTTALIIIFSLTFMLLIFSIIISNYLARDKYQMLDENCNAISQIVVADYNSAAYKRNAYNVANVLSNSSDTEIFITDTNGRIIICTCDDWYSQGTCAHTNAVIPQNIIDSVFSDEYKQFSNLGGVFDEICYTVGKPITSPDGAFLGSVISAATASSLKSLFFTLFQLYSLSAIIPIIFMFFAVYAMTYRWTKPLKMMSYAARSMAKGDFSKRIPIMSDDEIGELSISFNQMTNSLAELEGMRRSFVANISHELKTPMTTIAGFIDGIIDGTIEPEKEKYYLEIVSNEVKRLSRLVQSMLNLSKLESNEFKLNAVPFDFYETLCNIVIGQEQRISADNINIVGLDKIESVTINADRDLIYQVIYNLVDNAIKFTSPNGEISFDLKKAENKVIFKISNTGDGIPEKDLVHIFERFYKIDKSRSAKKDSTGLGLYIVKKIVDIHKGTVSVQSTQNGVTTFSVVLPINSQL